MITAGSNIVAGDGHGRTCCQVIGGREGVVPAETKIYMEFLIPEIQQNSMGLLMVRR